MKKLFKILICLVVVDFFYFSTPFNFSLAIKTEVVDTTGAGDAYWGGFLSSLMEQNVSCVRELSMEKLLKAGKYGAISGSLCVKKHGGIPALPYREDIEREIG